MKILWLVQENEMIKQVTRDMLKNTVSLIL